MSDKAKKKTTNGNKKAPMSFDQVMGALIKPVLPKKNVKKKR